MRTKYTELELTIDGKVYWAGIDYEIGYSYPSHPVDIWKIELFADDGTREFETPVTDPQLIIRATTLAQEALHE
jgi:hypothetical protein